MTVRRARLAVYRECRSSEDEKAKVLIPRAMHNNVYSKLGKDEPQLRKKAVLPAARTGEGIAKHQPYYSTTPA